MNEGRTPETAVDLLVVGSGPTGIAIGAEARRQGLAPLLVDRGPLTANLLGFPTYMSFFTTRDLLEIAGIPFAVPEEKPDRRQALTYYRSVADRFDLPLALHEEIREVRRQGELFEVVGSGKEGEVGRWARAVALATGYFHNPRRLGVAGEDLPWVDRRYGDPYGHFSERVVVIGGGNSAAEAALDLYRNGARVTIVHRGPSIKQTVKYWLKPDVENRISEGAITARFNAVVASFGDAGVEIEAEGGREVVAADAAYVLIGYLPEVGLLRRCGIEVDPQTLIPAHDPETCESNVAGLYVAGTLQAGARTDLIFIENSRDHGARIVRHLMRRLRPVGATAEP